MGKQHAISLDINRAMVGRTVNILVEGRSKKSDAFFVGRTDSNKSVVFPHNQEAAGEYIDIRIDRVNSATLFGERATGVQNHSSLLQSKPVP